MRVFLPSTMPLLREWWAAGSARPAGPAYAVTPALREWYREGDADELEHSAQTAAGRGSIELLAHDATAPRRRVVLAADVASARPEPGVHRAAVSLDEPVPRSAWAAVMADADDASVAVASAVADLGRAALGDEDAQFALDEADSHELGWYAVQELPTLLDLD